MAKVIEIDIPEYDVSKEIDYELIAKKIDRHIKQHFPGKKIVLRAVPSEEHQGDLDGIVNNILEHGTERVDSGWKGRAYNDVMCDFYGKYCDVDKDSMMGINAIRKGYEVPQKYGKPPMKADIFIIYDADHVEMVPYEKKRCI